MLIAQFDDIKKAYEYAKNYELQTGFKTKVICLAENAQIFDVVVDCDIEREPLTMERALNVIQEMLQEIDELKNVRKDLPDIQQPYVILYRQIKKELHKAEQKLEKIKEICKRNCNIRCTNYCSGKQKHCLCASILQIIESEE